LGKSTFLYYGIRIFEIKDLESVRSQGLVTLILMTFELTDIPAACKNEKDLGKF
jgi:hypothetical protein